MHKAILNSFFISFIISLFSSCGIENDAIGRTYELLSGYELNEDNIKCAELRFNYSFDSKTGSIIIEDINQCDGLEHSSSSRNDADGLIGTYNFNENGEDGIGFYKALDKGIYGDIKSRFVRDNWTKQSREENSEIKYCYYDASKFMENECSKIGQSIIAQNIKKFDRWFIQIDDETTGTLYYAPVYYYYFMTAPLDRSSYCIRIITQNQLKVAFTPECGDPYDIQKSWESKVWSQDPCLEGAEYNKDAVLKFGGLEIMIEKVSMDNWDGAVRGCEDFGDGWRLPTKDELNILYENEENIVHLKENIENIAALGYENSNVPVGFLFLSGEYWSSTEIDENYLDNQPDGKMMDKYNIDCGDNVVWVLSQDDGRFYCSDKLVSGYALPVRGNYNPAFIEKVVKDFEHEDETNEDVEEELDDIVEFFRIEDPDGWTNLRNSSGGEVLRKVYSDEKFEVIGEEGKYKEVKLNDGTVGFIHSSRVVSFNDKVCECLELAVKIVENNEDKDPGLETGFPDNSNPSFIVRVRDVFKFNLCPNGCGFLAESDIDFESEILRCEN